MFPEDRKAKPWRIPHNIYRGSRAVLFQPQRLTFDQQSYTKMMI